MAGGLLTEVRLILGLKGNSGGGWSSYRGQANTWTEGEFSR